MANQINFKVGYTVDKTGLNELKNNLQQIQKMTSSEYISLNKSLDIQAANAQLQQTKQTAKELESALTKSFNAKLGTYNVTQFNNELKKSGKSINDIYFDLTSAGAAGQSAFRKMNTEILTTNLQLKESHSILDNMARTMGNTIKWGISSSIMNSFTGAVQKAYGYVKNLDESLNNIQRVSFASTEQMREFAIQANKASQALGATTLDYTNASLIYYQQGLSDQEVAARTDTTIKMANALGSSAEDVSQYMTAI